MTDDFFFRSVVELQAEPRVRRFRAVVKDASATDLEVMAGPGIPAAGSVWPSPDGPMDCHRKTVEPSPYRAGEWEITLEYRKSARPPATTWDDVDKIKAALDGEAFRSLEVTKVPKGKPILIHLHVNTEDGVEFDEAGLIDHIAELHKKHPDLPPFVLTQGPRGSVEIKTILDPRG